MRKTAMVGPRLLALIGAVGLFSSTAIADVTVYSGGKSRVVETGTDRPTKVIAWGEPRETAIQRRVERFQMERMVQKIIDNRETEEDRALSDAMLRIITRGNAGSRKQYSKYYPYHYRSAGFYQTLKRAMQEQRAGVTVYRQSILDDVPREDLRLVAEALNEMK